MKIADDIARQINRPMMILVVSTNHSKVLLDTLCEEIYKSYPKHKVRIDRQKGLMRKVGKAENKLVYINVDASKIQISSSQSSEYRRRDFEALKTTLMESQITLLMKLNLQKYDIPHRGSWGYSNAIDQIVPFTHSVDIIYYIEKDGIYLSSYGSQSYPIDQLVRYCKLKKLKKSKL